MAPSPLPRKTKPRPIVAKKVTIAEPAPTQTLPPVPPTPVAEEKEKSEPVRLKVVEDLVTPKQPEPPVSRKLTVMSELWKKAHAKGIKGYNRMTRQQIEALLV